MNDFPKVISIAGLVFGEDAVRGEVFEQLQSLLGAEAAKAVQAILASVSDKPAQGVLSTVIGLAVLLIGATSVFGELQDALDRIWRAPVRDRAVGVWGRCARGCCHSAWCSALRSC